MIVIGFNLLECVEKIEKPAPASQRLLNLVPVSLASILEDFVLRIQ